MARLGFLTGIAAQASFQKAASDRIGGEWGRGGRCQPSSSRFQR